jgi:hypothetical protein
MQNGAVNVEGSFVHDVIYRDSDTLDENWLVTHGLSSGLWDDAGRPRGNTVLGEATICRPGDLLHRLRARPWPRRASFAIAMETDFMPPRSFCLSS